MRRELSALRPQRATNVTNVTDFATGIRQIGTARPVTSVHVARGQSRVSQAEPTDCVDCAARAIAPSHAIHAAQATCSDDLRGGERWAEVRVGRGRRWEAWAGAVGGGAGSAWVVREARGWRRQRGG